MSISDEAFREAFKPLFVPAHYAADDTEENKVVYALARLGEGSANDVALELSAIDQSINMEAGKRMATSILNNVFNKGLISGTVVKGITFYNLSKITEPNRGTVNPDLLAPGLD